VIEVTSGNTGIGLAMVCAVKGYPLVVVMGENFSIERRKLMRFLGAKGGADAGGAARHGRQRQGRGTGGEARLVPLPAVRQRSQRRHALAHHRAGDPRRLRGRRLDWFVTGAGTGGTLKGVARVLKAQRPETRIAVCEPDNSPVLASGIAQCAIPTAARRKPSAVAPARDAGLGAGLHSAS
jgi:cysteine synthase A